MVFILVSLVCVMMISGLCVIGKLEKIESILKLLATGPVKPKKRKPPEDEEEIDPELGR